MNTTAVAERPTSPVAEIRHQLEGMEAQFKAALPAHIPVERFARVVMTAVQNNPELMEVERRSLWNAAIKAAQDGLLPDGREGAMVVRMDRSRGKVANWQPMVAGIRKKVRNSGEIATWDAYVVHQNDAFDFELGDAPFIKHKPALTNRGPIVAAYSVATLKSGEISREVMSIEEIHGIRDRASDGWKAFKAGKIRSTPWASDEGEMCRKTVVRRHSKSLPMSTDLDDLIRRDDELYDFAGAKEEAQRARPRSLAGRLDALAGGGAAPLQIVADEDGEIIEDEDPAQDDAGEAAPAEREKAKPEPEAKPEPAKPAVTEKPAPAAKPAAKPAKEPMKPLTDEEKASLREFAAEMGKHSEFKPLREGSISFWEGKPDRRMAFLDAERAIYQAHSRRIAGEIDADEVAVRIEAAIEG